MAKGVRKRTPAIIRLDKILPRLELALALELRLREMADGREKEKYSDLVKLLRSDEGLESHAGRISTLAAFSGISYYKLVEAYRDFKRMEGIVEVAQRLPGVLEGIAEDAQPSFVTCPPCKGVGRIPLGDGGDTELCLGCDGAGKIRKPGDAVARKQVLEMMDLTGPRAVPIVPITNSNVIVASGSLEDTLRAARAGGMNGASGMADRSEADQPVLRPDRLCAGEDPAGAVQD